MPIRRNTTDVLFNLMNYAFLAVLGVVTLYPFVNLLAISLNDSVDAIRGGIYIYPRVFSLNNYKIIFQNDQLYSAAMISIIRTVVGTFLSVLCTTMLAYTLSRREFMARKLFNIIIIFSLYVNGGLIPFYVLIKNLHLNNTFWVYIIPGLVAAFNVIIIRSFFEQLPEGLIESAKIDGASELQVLFRVLIPISMPVIATITLFVAVGHWNSWFDNYLYNSKQSLSVLQYELMKILTESMQQVTASASGHVDEDVLQVTTPQSIRASMTIIVTVPILLVYPFMQRYFIKGIMVGAMKE
ncbi:carbohydrate ABC transporter permease [Paenibacillus sp. LHD-38]|uniref:carbohydrate ABC transporter permease n=1 Tax=Paenibacillus sp. LHD-38 TaxID=3072143 RepID=UPI00280DDEC0|nr:carbohydrate ABC transporter permease [Paenibacillus sp. LHD-38]MDQ8737111.1 carbohydrate ABC transporter permease [Paenibacillus sp. LHD-38]